MERIMQRRSQRLRQVVFSLLIRWLAITDILVVETTLDNSVVTLNTNIHLSRLEYPVTYKTKSIHRTPKPSQEKKKKKIERISLIDSRPLK